MSCTHAVDAMTYLNNQSKYQKMAKITGCDCEMVDLNAASVVKKVGNGDTPQNELLAEIQENVRERFALTSPMDSEDDY